MKRFILGLLCGLVIAASVSVVRAGGLLPDRWLRSAAETWIAERGHGWEYERRYEAYWALDHAAVAVIFEANRLGHTGPTPNSASMVRAIGHILHDTAVAVQEDR